MRYALLILLLSTASHAQPLELIAGTGGPGYGGDGGPATEALLNVPNAVFVDAQGNVYISDIANRRIRRIDGSGMIETVAGNGESSRSGDRGAAVDAAIFGPSAVFLDGAGVLYFSEWNGNSLRRVDAAGRITSFAGTGIYGYGGEGQQAVVARLWNPSDIFRSGTGEIYLSEWSNHRIRRIERDGSLVTLAGTGIAGFTGDGGPAVSARINGPNGLFVGEDGVVYFSDLANHRVRRIALDGTITTVAGLGFANFSGDGGPADRAGLDSPSGLFVDASGTLYIADTRNGRIRTVKDGIIQTLIGPERGDRMRAPNDVFVDTRGDIYISDGSGHSIYRVAGLGEPTHLSGAAPKPIDFDANGEPDFADFLIFVAQFNAVDPDPRFDLAEDGRIDFSDFLLFARAFASP